MKTLALLLLLCALSFGQMTVSDAQRHDCSNAKEAVKKSGLNPNLTPQELTTLLRNLQHACGAPDNTQPVTDIRKAVAECARTLVAFDKTNLTNLPMNEFNALLDSVARDCRTRPGAHDNVTAAKDSHPTPEAEDSQPAHEPEAQDSQVASDIHTLIAQSSTVLNREIALANRLIAHLQRAQTWEGIDPDHPDAVALREKIAQEEKELASAVRADLEMHDKIDVHRAQKECTKEELSRWVGMVKETTGVMQELKTQQDRYHALGY